MNLSKSKPASIHRGFTLIELLFVIAIISVLAVMSLGIMKGAQDDAKEAATLSRILQVESILQVELEDYEVRRLPIALSTLAGYSFNNPLYGDNDSNGVPDKLAVQVRNLKRRILQDIINAEIPRPFVNVSNQLVFNQDTGRFPTENPGAGTGGVGFKDWLDNYYPGLYGVLNGVPSSRVRAWANFVSTMEPTDTTAPNYYENFNLPGEYLYQTLASMDFDGAPAIEMLGNQAIGNSDDDAFLEVVDAWGEPLQLRIWQAGAIEGPGGPGSPTPLTSGVTDVWNDVPTDFDVRDASGLPIGYSVLDPTVPRDTTKIRFEVISTRLPF